MDAPKTSRRRSTHALLALVAMAMVASTSCAAVPWFPQAVVNVPGNHTFGATTEGYGVPGGTLVLCSATRTNVVVTATSPFEHNWTLLQWNEASVPSQTIPFNDVLGYTTTLAFGPVDPGCGQIALSAFFDMPAPGGGYVGPASIAFYFNTCDPESSLSTCLAAA